VLVEMAFEPLAAIQAGFSVPRRGIARDTQVEAGFETFSVEQDVVATIAAAKPIVPVLSAFSEPPFGLPFGAPARLLLLWLGALFRRNLELHGLPCLPAETISDLTPSVLYALAAPPTPKKSAQPSPKRSPPRTGQRLRREGAEGGDQESAQCSCELTGVGVGLIVAVRALRLRLYGARKGLNAGSPPPRHQIA
jgi:hypothetical protein